MGCASSMVTVAEVLTSIDDRLTAIADSIEVLIRDAQANPAARGLLAATVDERAAVDDALQALKVKEVDWTGGRDA